MSLLELLIAARNKKTSLANYDPEDDWESTCHIVKHFISQILSENNSTLSKVVFRNNILLLNQKQFNPSKPQSCYFLSSVIKYVVHIGFMVHKSLIGTS